MKAAAFEAGIDPALVERAARFLSAGSPRTRFERLIGGPLRHSSEMHLPVTLDEDQATQLLAAVQIRVEQPGSGHSSSAGMVWHAHNEMETLRITAQPEEGGTSVAVHVDRGGILAFIQVATLVGSVVATAVGVSLADQVAPVFGAVAGAAGIGGILAFGRSYWASSTRQVRKQINDLMDVIGEAALPPAKPQARSATGDDPKDVTD
jgi:hypothetical protein